MVKYFSGIHANHDIFPFSAVFVLVVNQDRLAETYQQGYSLRPVT